MYAVGCSATELTFVLLAGSVCVTGGAVLRWRASLPALLPRAFLYGGFAHRGSGADSPGEALLSRLELRKATFRHFYVFAAIAGSAALLLLALAPAPSPGPLLAALRLLLGPEPRTAVCEVAALGAMSMLMLQVNRRLYETQRLQVFAEHSKINITHYAAGFIHYLGCIVTIVGQSPAFSGNRKAVWLDDYTRVVAIPCCVVFLLAWYEQYRSNVIFANLRRDTGTGRVVTQEHRVPYGRLFKYVSSPHRLTEIVMYASLLVLFPTRTFFCIYVWVLANQVQTAVHAHHWYRRQFKNYPMERLAVFPFLL